ncbi:MAG: gamma-glutamyl-gamma-aminobutyrate hydrolase family protein [Oscillospiraceae bacterium]|nr:gamma-glutamyl-gamma-aminobutyrate hydrolase family protein [Oscillospiraceae bacterium]
MDRPIRIAIPTVRGTADNYVLALKMLGAEPVIVHEVPNVAEFDGLLIHGGVADVNPKRYGQELCGSASINDALDELQFSVLEAFAKAKKPVFGICRGHQLINVYFGGTLVQDMPRAAHHIFGMIYLAHGAKTVPDSFLTQLYGEEFSINSSHHECVDQLGPEMRTALVADDGTIEATQHNSLPVWSVQWHPELMCGRFARRDTVNGGIVLRWFIEQCGKERA